MATHENRPDTALLVVDMQNGVTAGTVGRDTVVANVAGLVDSARHEHVPVIWTLHTDDHLPKDSDDWQLVPELTPGDDEPRIEKEYADCFDESSLENVLADLRVGRLIVVGAQTDEGIRSTLHGALVRGYDAILVSDAHTTEDLSQWGAPPPDAVIAHTNLYWGNHRAPGRSAGTVETKDVDFAGTS
jgi:nicotinamidase-related amidase